MVAARWNSGGAGMRNKPKGKEFVTKTCVSMFLLWGKETIALVITCNFRKQRG